MTRLTEWMFLAGLLLASAALVQAQGGGVTFERLQNAAAEPHNWLTYSGGYHSNRHTALEQITTANVDELEVRWVFQAQSLQVFQTTPLVVDGVMYITEAPNTVLALDAKLGRVFWRYEYTPALESRPCCGRVNRGVAILGNTLYMGTIDAQLIAIDAITGKPLWKTAVGDPEDGHALTLAPLIVKDKVVVGIAGGEFGIRGFISAYDAASGEEAWKFYTIPGPGEPGHETWENDAWRTGGAPAWLTGSYDPLTDLIYWGTGNPGPRLEPGAAARRQPVLRVGRRARPGHRRAGLAFPVHAERSVRLRLGAGAGAGGLPRAGRQHAAADVLGQPQRFLLRARPHDRPLHQRPAVRVPQLGRRARRCRTPHHDAAAAGRHDVSGRPGRHELVFAVLQPVDAPVLPVGLGGVRLALHAAGGGI